MITPRRTSTMTFPSGALRAELSGLVRLAVVDLFSELGTSVTHLEEMQPAEELWQASIAFIGFRGPQLTGAMMVSASGGLLAATHPAGTHEEDALADWSCELANMTLGAFKARLCSLGVGLEMGLPAAIGVAGTRVTTTSPRPIGHRFLGGRWPLLAALDVATAPDLRLVPRAGDLSSDRLTVQFF